QTGVGERLGWYGISCATELPLVRHRAVHVALVFALGDGLALVAFLLALGHADEQFRPAAHEVHLQRNQRVALLVGLLHQFFDFAPIGQQDSFSRWLVLARFSGVGILGNVYAVQSQTHR